MVKFYPKFFVNLGIEGVDSIHVLDSSGDWQEVPSFEYFKVVKKQNQVSEFEVSFFDLQSAEKDYVKEFAKIAFYAGGTLILKGRIQKVTYETAYGATVTGYGMESDLLDKEFDELSNTSATWSDSKRAQYTNTSAQTIANELLSSGSDGASPWIMNPDTVGLFATDWGEVSMRYEYANRLNALAKLAESISYDWWVKQGDNLDDNYFCIAPYQPDSTQSANSQETYAITGDDANCSLTSKETDITNLANKIEILGYGDGVNQLHTSTYNASAVNSTLSSDITSTATTIGLSDADDFASSGTIRIAEEQITYSGKSGDNLTGCTRAANSTTAYAHKKYVYVEKYLAIGSAESGSSIDTNGLLDYTITDRGILDLATAEQVASKILLERKDPIVRIRIIPNEPLETARDREIGELVTITDAESDLSSTYRIVGMTYVSDYGNISIELECSNRTLNFIEQMNKEKQEKENLQRYMQGSTNIYAINESENCDDSTDLNLRFYLPSEAININKVLLSFKMKDFRSYTATAQTAATANHTHSIGSSGSHSHGISVTCGGEFNANSPDANIGFDSNNHLCDGAGHSIGNIGVIVNAKSTDSATHTHSIGASGGHTHAITTGFEINEETLSNPSVDVSVGTEGSESAIDTYTTDQEDIDITTEVADVGAGNWINIKFKPNKRMRIESNAYIQIFIKSR